MPAGAAHPVLRFLRRIRVADGAAEAPDALLLERFVGGRDEAAFAALVRRHGAMVFGVCTRVLGDTPEAEDAFQATFLVLVRRARSVGRPELLGPWLYGVAHRAALKARTEAARRRRHEGRVVPRAVADPAGDVDGHDLRAVLDDEVNRLPAKYRLPVVLCHLEGRTHEEAARQIGCPRETVTTRLTRARERLRGRLVRRGVTLSAGAFAAAWAEDAVRAGVPAPRVEATVKAATAFAAGQAASGLIPARVAALTEGVLRAMLLTNLKIATAVLLGVGIVAGGVGMQTRPTSAAEPGQGAGQKSKSPGAAARAEADKGGGRSATVEESPPVVVKTVPQAGDTHVDAAATKEIRVTFSKDMADKSWSWSQTSDETFPKTTGKPHYEPDHRTCVLPVKLEPGKTYVLWLNPAKFQGFRDTQGNAAVFYPLVFETRPR